MVKDGDTAAIHDGVMATYRRTNDGREYVIVDDGVDQASFWEEDDRMMFHLIANLIADGLYS